MTVGIAGVMDPGESKTKKKKSKNWESRSQRTRFPSSLLRETITQPPLQVDTLRISTESTFSPSNPFFSSSALTLS